MNFFAQALIALEESDTLLSVEFPDRDHLQRAKIARERALILAQLALAEATLNPVRTVVNL